MNDFLCLFLGRRHLQQQRHRSRQLVVLRRSLPVRAERTRPAASEPSRSIPVLLTLFCAGGVSVAASSTAVPSSAISGVGAGEEEDEDALLQQALELSMMSSLSSMDMYAPSTSEAAPPSQEPPAAEVAMGGTGEDAEVRPDCSGPCPCPCPCPSLSPASNSRSNARLSSLPRAIRTKN